MFKLEVLKNLQGNPSLAFPQFFLLETKKALSGHSDVRLPVPDRAESTTQEGRSGSCRHQSASAGLVPGTMLPGFTGYLRRTTQQPQWLGNEMQSHILKIF